MARQATNKLLQKAKKSKSDEFYTQLCEIESELQHYTNCFVDKVVYCNCDNPQISNFFRYFKDNFQRLGLKKLIASCFCDVEMDHSNVNAISKAYYCEYEGDNIPMKIVNFEGNGDFRSAECVELGAKNGSYQFLVVDGARQPQAAIDAGIDKVNVMDYDFDDAKKNTGHYVEDFTKAVNAAVTA